ncbi:MAG: transcription antitermination factor NusB [Candidatus Tagabacteria bacterium]
MANRHLSRSLAMQSLYEWDFNKSDKSGIDAIIERNVKEFAPGLEDAAFIENLVRGVLKNQKAIDAIIEKAAPEWPLEQIAIIDRNVLRLGLYELLFSDRQEVPPKVAINEAIELVKTFGGETSGKFVNGVLGTVYREIGEPGKDETGKKKTVSPDGGTGLPEEKLGGALVYRRENGDIFFALVHDVFGYWTLSKGKLEKGEDAEAGASREVKEELGLKNLKIEKELGSNNYIAYDPERGQIKKTVAYFLASTSEKNLHLEKSGGLDDAKWFELKEVSGLKIYDDLRPIIEKAIEWLSTSQN